MSLINKMLRDLDARHAEGGRGVLPDEVRPLPAPRESSGIRLAIFGLVATAAAAVLAWTMWSPSQSTAVSPPKPLSPINTAAIPVPIEALPMPPLVVMVPSPAAAESATEPLPEPPAKTSTKSAPLPARSANSGDKVATLRLETSLADLTNRAVSAPTPTATPTATAATPAATPAIRPSQPVEKQLRGDQGPEQRAEAEYRKGLSAYRLGRGGEATADFKAALQVDPAHVGARQMLLSQLTEQRQWDQAQALLREGLERIPSQTSWAMALARIEVERGNLAPAWDVLHKYMAAGEANPDFQAFAGTLLQRLQRPREAAQHYQAALRLRPAEGRWWVGLGMALEADGKPQEAREAYVRARESGAPGADMAAFIERKLRP